MHHEARRNKIAVKKEKLNLKKNFLLIFFHKSDGNFDKFKNKKCFYVKNHNFCSFGSEYILSLHDPVIFLVFRFAECPAFR